MADDVYILPKLENAIAGVLTGLGLAEVAIYGALDDNAQTLPKIIVRGGQARELYDIGLYGNYRVTVGVRVATSADEPGARDTHNGIVAAVFNALMMDDLKDTLSAVADITVFSVENAQQEHGSEDRHFFSEWAAEFICCPSDV